MLYIRLLVSALETEIRMVSKNVQTRVKDNSRASLKTCNTPLKFIFSDAEMKIIEPIIKSDDSIQLYSYCTIKQKSWSIRFGSH